MSKHYVRRWYELDDYYDELIAIDRLLVNNPNNEELLCQKRCVLKKIKHFLRYNTPKEDFRS